MCSTHTTFCAMVCKSCLTNLTGVCFRGRNQELFWSLASDYEVTTNSTEIYPPKLTLLSSFRHRNQNHLLHFYVVTQVLK